MADSVHIKGLSDLAKFLDTLAPRLQKNVMRSALRSGANVIKAPAKANIHSVSGELAKGLKVSTRSRGTTVTATLKTTGPHSFIGPLVEYGTHQHFIKPKNRKAVAFGNVVYRSVNHPGAKPHPFLRVAMDQYKGAAAVAVAQQMATVLATKHGLDTASVEIAEG